MRLPAELCKMQRKKRETDGFSKNILMTSPGSHPTSGFGTRHGLPKFFRHKKRRIVQNDVPVVEKQILWSKRCKDKALVGTVKETVMQVSRSKKWASKPLLDESGKPVLQKNGKPVLKKSYSVLQDNFFNYMRNAGYTDVERGERGSTEEHLTVTQFKVQREQERLDTLTAQADQQKQSLAAIQKKSTLTKNALIHAQDVATLGKKTLLGNYSLTEEEFSQLKSQAAHGFMVDVENRQLKQQLSAAQQNSINWQTRYRNLRNEVQPYLDAMRHAPERVRNFLRIFWHRNRNGQQMHRPKLATRRAPNFNVIWM